jgi:hypothetical protein
MGGAVEKERLHPLFQDCDGLCGFPVSVTFDSDGFGVDHVAELTGVFGGGDPERGDDPVRVGYPSPQRDVVVHQGEGDRRSAAERFVNGGEFTVPERGEEGSHEA